MTELRLECWKASPGAWYDSRVLHLPLGENNEAVMTDQLPFLNNASVKSENSCQTIASTSSATLKLLTQAWLADMTKPHLLIPASLLVFVATRLVGDAHEEL